MEHKTLSAANAENYSIAAAKKLGELGPICATLKEWDQVHNVRLNKYSHIIQFGETHNMFYNLVP